MKRSLAPAALLCFSFLLPVASAQQNATATQPLPKDPVAMLKLASQLNGLHGDDLKPWHVHATWKMFDQKGQPSEQGTFEEWWAGKDSIRISLASPGFQQTRWVTTQGEFVAGDQVWPSWIFRLLHSTLQSPLPDDRTIAATPFHSFQEKRGSVLMDCGEFNPRDARLVSTRGYTFSPLATMDFNRYCFTNDLPAIRIKETPATQMIFDSIVLFQGHYIARLMQLERVDMPAIRIYIDELESPTAGQNLALNPPPDAVPSFYWVGEPRKKGFESARPIAGKDFAYPPEARKRHIQGSVEIAGIIGKNGVLGNLEIIGGPELLQKTTMDTLKTWRYAPALLNGDPTEIPITITVPYPLP